MEQLLSTSFDLLSSYDPLHVRKGLRCLEGFLAKMCLQTPSQSRRTSAASSVGRESYGEGIGGDRGRLKGAVEERPNDAAFMEFMRLQNGFEWNVTIRLISCLERLLGRANNGQTNLLILSALELIQGMLLLHPPSRKLFAREIHMNVLLDLLDVGNSGPVQSATLLTLVSALMDHPENTRSFEALDGLPTICALFRSPSTPRDVKLRTLEFLYFYLMPEPVTVGPPSAAVGHPPTPLPSGHRGSKSREVRLDRTTEEKQALLGEHMQNVESLVADLRESQPFGI
ncbi:cell division control 14, SIN component [Ascodesmis nigricans]|uniref:Cell division control 14, SIN component n=1 Tax=Ascodesmis nigricans TaxID=341454 RepID=A0A4S2N289_9PEZI|nr:cell division control 14, SIN component [Ascodesmis nigricans]